MTQLVQKKKRVYWGPRTKECMMNEFLGSMKKPNEYLFLEVLIDIRDSLRKLLEDKH